MNSFCGRNRLRAPFLTLSNPLVAFGFLPNGFGGRLAAPLRNRPVSIAHRIPIDEADNAFSSVEPLLLVAECPQCGASLRYFRRTWQMLLDQSERSTTEAYCGPVRHTLVLEDRRVVEIRCSHAESS